MGQESTIRQVDPAATQPGQHQQQGHQGQQLIELQKLGEPGKPGRALSQATEPESHPTRGNDPSRKSSGQRDTPSRKPNPPSPASPEGSGTLQVPPPSSACLQEPEPGAPAPKNKPARALPSPLPLSPARPRGAGGRAPLPPLGERYLDVQGSRVKGGTSPPPTASVHRGQTPDEPGALRPLTNQPQ